MNTLISHRARPAMAGQATTEMLFFIPLMCLLMGGAMMVLYVCWQGVRTQEAANLGARIQGQERVGGGPTTVDIDDVNGKQYGDGDPSLQKNELIANHTMGFSHGGKDAPSTSVYGHLRQAIQGFLGQNDRDVYVPPVKNGINTDQVLVRKIIRPVRIPWLDKLLAPIVLEGSAYGGEDPHAFALPRWGYVGSDKSNLYWQKSTVQPGKDDHR